MLIKDIKKDSRKKTLKFGVFYIRDDLLMLKMTGRGGVMKVYKSFASQSTRNSYICKSEITRDLLRGLNIPDGYSVDKAKKIFDSLRHERYVILVETGSKFDPKKRRKTKFVSKFFFYKSLVD